MRIWDRVRHSLAALGLAAMAAGAAAPADAKTARPAMWKVYDRDTEIYLFGTVHLLPPGTQWRTAAFDKAAKQAGTLVVETSSDEKNPQAFAMELARLSVRPGLPPVLDRVRPERRAALQSVITRSGIPVAALNNMETWAAAFALLQLQFTGQESAGTDLLEAQDLGGRDHAAALHLFAVGSQLYLEIQFGFAHKRAQPHDALNDFLAHKGIDGLADSHPGQAEALGEITLGRQRGTRRAGGTDVCPQDFPQLHVDRHPALAVDLADHRGRIRGRHGSASRWGPAREKHSYLKGKPAQRQV